MVMVLHTNALAGHAKFAVSPFFQLLRISFCDVTLRQEALHPHIYGIIDDGHDLNTLCRKFR